MKLLSGGWGFVISTIKDSGTRILVERQPKGTFTVSLTGVLRTIKSECWYFCNL